MNTDDLIRQLAADPAPIDRGLLARRIGIALIGGALGAVLLMAMLFGVRADLASVAQTPLFWAKVAFPLLLSLGALMLFSRLARPGIRPGGAIWLLLVPVILVWLGSVVALTNAPDDSRLAMVLGHTWKTCPANIALLAIPAFVGNLWVLRAMAPTRLRLAGAAAGLLAGSTATVAYCLHCPEMAVPFWGVWYLLGMLVPATVGALLGRRLLRW